MVEVATVQALESLLTAGYRVELDEDVTLAVGVDSNVNDLAVLLVTLGLDLNLEILDPVIAPVALFPVTMLAMSHRKRKETYSSASKAFSILMHLEAMGLSTTGARGLLMTG